MKVLSQVKPSSTSEASQEPAQQPAVRQPLVQRQSFPDVGRPFSMNRSNDSERRGESRLDQQASQSPVNSNRFKRYMQEPQQEINESFQNYQRRHHEWHNGVGPIPEDEGKPPKKSWADVAVEIALGIATAPGVAPGDPMPAKLPGFGAEPPPVPKISPDVEARPAAVEVEPSTSEATGPGRASQSEKAGASNAVARPEATPEAAGAHASKVPDIDWNEFMKEDASLFEDASDRAELRQKALYDKAGIPHPDSDIDGGTDSESGIVLQDDSSDSESSMRVDDDGSQPDYDLVSLYTHAPGDNFNNIFRFEGARVRNKGDIEALADIVEGLPKTEGVPLYRGTSGERGATGAMFRAGDIKAGDEIINTDFTSFTENPYLVKDYFGKNIEKKPGQYRYDDTSVVFVVDSPKDAHGIAPLSVTPNEAESLYTPGHRFVVKEVKTSDFNGRPLVQVHLEERDPGVSTSARTFDLGTGKPFDRDDMLQRIGAGFADRFFPQH